MMPSLTFSPVQSWWVQLDRFTAPPAIRTLLRTASHQLRPAPSVPPFVPTICQRQDAVLAGGQAGPHQLATIIRDFSRGPVPTIVLGGFVPDASEAVFLMRDYLRRQGSLYCVNYPRHGFHLELLFAQLDDLVEELALRYGQAPVIFAVSFGAGLLLEWLRRHRVDGGSPALRGVVLISPVACVEDLLPEAGAKPTTLLGRAIKPYLEAGGAVDPRLVDKSRAIFSKMFEAGAQNRSALKGLMTAGELQQLRSAVLGTIQGIDFAGACERVQSLKRMVPPSAYFQLEVLPLCEAPTLVLYSEKEEAVIAEGSPTRRAFAAAHRAYFPRSDCRMVCNQKGAPVQHASLIFHCTNFLPVLAGFYRRIRTQRERLAA
ncbi:MAG TPA: hypothetical protein VMC06_13370 [Opitutaceae bacterium]|nr:hypothetical protein [Opitutaceae bacterium]